MKNNWEKVDLIGILATEEEISKAYSKQNIFINSNDFIQFYIKLISTTPYDYPNLDNKTKYIACFSTSLYDLYKDDTSKSQTERINDFYNFIHDKFVCLNVEQKEDYTILNKYFYNGHIKEVLPRPSKIKQADVLHPVPIFNKSNASNDINSFLHDLSKNSKFRNNSHISKELDDTPEMIFYEDDDNDIFAIGEIKSFDFNEDSGISFNFDERIHYFKLEEEDYKSLIVNKNNVAFITTFLIQKIEGKILGDSENIIELETDKKAKKDEIEEKFLNHFIDKLTNENLVYSKKDILNFHTAMKTSKLVILSGMSGTGKSKLIKAYANALGLKDNFKFIPVSPSWTEDSDIIGYADTLNMIYRPDDHGLIETLIQAKLNPDKLFIVCFDEMNLARIEHYFSQFLSLLESDVDNRKLQLYNKELGGKLYNSSKYNHEITIGKNVRFVGTVNIDESTHHFSNKVLDRADLITLEVMPFKQLVKIANTEKIKTTEGISFEQEYIESFFKNSKTIDLDNDTIEFLQEIHNILLTINNQSGIGPRVIKHIDYYLKNIPNYGGVLSYGEGLDFQVIQRILSKIRGSREELEFLIGSYNPDNNSVISSHLLSLMDKYENISDFTNSRKVILNKSRELYINGFTF
ncbi:McrB family protein [Staphylococcus argenteus]|uniref:McrB family protein n=1 Tax=Staphylococcus argenteus TaxID=985002 RepID=UPI001EFC34A8|nr:AAA family ATPase [Staphylococcus argenteus]MCG9803882.1 AAA family ATPase [Staphylococcus argenteus]MCG9810385.1 AAA family ATPase [Staphylococcus argenteus]MCG9824742.1 AAA family ATPase [Staphylococcus argenteus]